MNFIRPLSRFSQTARTSLLNQKLQRSRPQTYANTAYRPDDPTRKVVIRERTLPTESQFSSVSQVKKEMASRVKEPKHLEVGEDYIKIVTEYGMNFGLPRLSPELIDTLALSKLIFYALQILGKATKQQLYDYINDQFPGRFASKHRMVLCLQDMQRKNFVISVRNPQNRNGSYIYRIPRPELRRMEKKIKLGLFTDDDKNPPIKKKKKVIKLGPKIKNYKTRYLKKYGHYSEMPPNWRRRSRPLSKQWEALTKIESQESTSMNPLSMSPIN